MGLKKKLTKENMKGMSEYSKEKLYAKAADKYGIKYESKSVGGRPGQSNEKPGMGAKHAVNAAMEADPNFAIAKAMGGTEGDKKTISHYADYKKQGKQVNDGEFGGYKANSKVAANAYQASQDLLKENILSNIPKQEVKTPSSNTSNETVELSARAQAAVDAGGDYTFKPVERNLGNEDLAYDPNAGIADKNAGQFLSNYKADIEQGVKASGAKPRGAMSLHNRF